MDTHKIVRIAEHAVLTATSSEWIAQWLSDNYRAEEVLEGAPGGPGAREGIDLVIRLADGYGTPFESYDVSITKGEAGTEYRRSDYRVRMNSNHTEALVDIHDEFGLKHAMLNVFSAYVVYREWGLLVHSSCVVDGDEAYLFTGRSGAGKSTAAMLSIPRLVLSDEAALLKVTDEGVVAFNSPFRSDSPMDSHRGVYPLKGIHFLQQSREIKRESVAKIQGLTRMFDYIFYWAHDREETRKLVRLVHKASAHVPFYDLYFQKNNAFWECVT